jgi:HlyD family secretion protein
MTKIAAAAYSNPKLLEISSAKAELDAVESNLALARKTEDRQLKLWKANATTAQNVDNARWSRIVLEKQAASARAVYELKVAGLRPDEVRQTKAALDAGRAAVDSLTYQIETAAVLVSPVNGVVRTRMAEPGDMASAARTVYQISIMDPKWVRAYVSETQLKYVQEGAEALVTTDTTEPLKARVGHISSEAEFTPKTVATQDLRTVLVYEVRLNVEDPGNRLRLGQPVTVDFAP